MTGVTLRFWHLLCEIQSSLFTEVMKEPSSSADSSDPLRQRREQRQRLLNRPAGNGPTRVCTNLDTITGAGSNDSSEEL